MHIMEGFLPPRWAAAWTLAAAPIVVYGAKQTIDIIRQDTRVKALVAIGIAFVFILSALKFPSVTGSTSHPTGTGLLVVLFGPAVTAFTATIVLLYQALLLAHGGITTLGANVVAMGIIGPTVGWTAYQIIRPYTSLERATFIAAVLTDWTTYLVTSLQLGAAFPAGDGLDAIIISALDFAAIFTLTQVPIGILEGILAAAVIGYLTRLGSETIESLEVAA
ncbi:energy-coupling factor ABC transporter permease [Haloquadratum walsbyi]|jgi:cobalt/nickel transport system permease protein|uniref:Putative cobalt transport protein CbiM n=1 Tax=Haloquadratum walsbyi (strain DSM 16854 / JCM 12705 / C23) TaxID=768065 RepID=G0LKC9_HALWC|nr:energy-coupling factor ABC transporter permease [Haloquadratum walsbyi]CCC39887.1 ABC-type transport system permease protein (probable substrate cobalt) [Haloquadratum walsbyi C23]